MKFATLLKHKSNYENTNTKGVCHIIEIQSTWEHIQHEAFHVIELNNNTGIQIQSEVCHTSLLPFTLCMNAHILFE